MIMSMLFLKENLDKLKPISFIFLSVIIVLMIDILIEAPFFRNYYINNPGDTPFKVELFKPLRWEFIPLAYSMMLSYYV